MNHFSEINEPAPISIYGSYEGENNYYTYGKFASLEEAVNLIKQHTRNYAKRQITWWNKDQSIKWKRVDISTNPLPEVLQLINS